MSLLALGSLALAFAQPSAATVYSGNPKVGFRVDRPQGDYLDGLVSLAGVRIHYCGGGSDYYSVGENVDPVAGHFEYVTGGDLCGVTWDWGSTMSIDGSGSSGAYTVEVTDATTFVDVDPDIVQVAATSWSVVSGTMSGGGPWVLTYIE